MLEKILHYIDPLLTKEQKEEFQKYCPAKIYKTERNVAIVVAITQVLMMIVFLLNPSGLFEQNGGVWYLLLYASLLVATLCFLPLYRYATRGQKYQMFYRVRRCYVFILCCWLLGITVLEQQGGMGINIYCYLFPTLAAVMIWMPREGFILFSGNWLCLLVLLLNIGESAGAVMPSIINSLIVTVLAMYISNRYYQRMAVEYLDRKTIEVQYREIQDANELLHQMAYTDLLTGMYNRHYLTETIFSNFETYQQNGLWGEILMVDIDHFKKYNDSYGHLQGDKCLKQVSEKILNVCKEKELIPIRYGGEEFLLVNIKERYEMAEDVARMIQSEIGEILIPRGKSDADRVTVSIGVWRGKLQDVERIEQAIRFADQMLYQAKETGRNRTCYYS